jgi:hypothetical protein
LKTVLHLPPLSRRQTRAIRLATEATFSRQSSKLYFCDNVVDHP